MRLGWDKSLVTARTEIAYGRDSGRCIVQARKRADGSWTTAKYRGRSGRCGKLMPRMPSRARRQFDRVIVELSFDSVVDASIAPDVVDSSVAQAIARRARENGAAIAYARRAGLLAPAVGWAR